MNSKKIFKHFALFSISIMLAFVLMGCSIGSNDNEKLYEGSFVSSNGEKIQAEIFLMDDFLLKKQIHITDESGHSIEYAVKGEDQSALPKDYYAMVLECRNSSNTCRNILKTGKCNLNFITHEKKYFKEAVRLGFPGETPEEKMKDCIYTLVDGKSARENPNEVYPKIVKEAYQVFECTWVKELDNAGDDKIQEEYNGPYHDFNGITSKYGAHFILKIDNILMKDKYYDTIINGVSACGFPMVPVDYGYRDSKNFWYSKFKRPISMPIPKDKGVGLDSVKYAAGRIDPDVKFTDEACQMLVKVPRVFLNMVLKGCVQIGRAHV